jgi:hypothetical protein
MKKRKHIDVAKLEINLVLLQLHLQMHTDYYDSNFGDHRASTSTLAPLWRRNSSGNLAKQA